MRTYFAFLCLLITLVGWTGQIPGHIYIALQGRAGLTGTAKADVEANLAYYLTGAQGPDTIGIIQFELQKISFFNSVNEETHYSPKKALLAFNLLAKANTAKERAFALGWMTHYVDDVYIHPVVNNYGGFYELNPKHHKELEQIETKHVFARHGDVVTKTWATTIPTQFGIQFSKFIFDAYHETYPEEPKYQPDATHWGLVPNRDYFGDQANAATGWCLSAENTFYNSHIDGTGKHGFWPSTIPIPNMPSNEKYQQFMHAVEIQNITTFNDHLSVTVKVNDSKMYGRFLADWEKAANQAIADTKQLLAAASEYLDKPSPDNRFVLLKLIPNQNLDQPLPDFNAKLAFPGDIVVPKISYRLWTTPLPTQGKDGRTPLAIDDKSGPITYAAAEYCGSGTGTVTFNIPLKGDNAPYKYILQVGLSGKEAFIYDEYREVDWIKVEGRHPGVWMSDVGVIGLGQPFTVTVPIPPEMRGNEGVRRWAVMTSDHDLKIADLVGLDMNAWGKEIRPDVVVLEEKLTPTAITATLQLCDMVAWEKQFLGNNSLIFLWSPYGKPGDLGGFEAAALAGKDLLAIHDRLSQDKRFEKSEQELMAYLATLEKQNLTDAERERLLIKHFTELVAKSGLPEAAEVAAKARITLAAYNMPFLIEAPITLCATSLAFPLLNGWKEELPTTPRLFHDRQLARKTQQEKDDNGQLKWSITSSLETTWCTRSAVEEQQLAKAHPDAEKLLLDIGDYQGTLFLERGEGRTAREHNLYGWALLRRGQTSLKINITINGIAGQFFGKDAIAYDGKDDLLKNIDTTWQEINQMLEGFTTTLEQ